MKQNKHGSSSSFFNYVIGNTYTVLAQCLAFYWLSRQACMILGSRGTTTNSLEPVKKRHSRVYLRWGQQIPILFDLNMTDQVGFVTLTL